MPIADAKSHFSSITAPCTGLHPFGYVRPQCLLFFGGKKIPELMKELGKGIHSFKEGMNEVKQEIKVKADEKE